MIGVSGGSGSGKSHFCREFIKKYESGNVILISADHYFKKELPKMISPLTQKEYDDWNSPESLDYDALMADVKRALEKAPDILIIEGAYFWVYEGQGSSIRSWT